MAYLLDTNVAIHLRDGDPGVTARVAALDGAVLLSIVTRVELEGGAYGAIVAQAGNSRRKLLDRMIAAQALVHRATLITGNEHDFAGVAGLQLLVW